jgi:hypothetical protein
MIKDLDHARAVCERRKATGKKGLPRAVVRWLKHRDTARTVVLSDEAFSVGLPYIPRYPGM